MDLMNESLLFFALIHGNEDIVKSLIKAGANVNHCTVLPGTGEKQSLLNRLLDESGEFSKASNLVNLVQILIENGASVNECEEGSDSPLIKAVRLSSFDLVDLLLQHGANVNHHGKSGFTALHECCVKGKFEVEHPNTEIFNLLLGAGASVNSQTGSVDTSVSTGINYGCFKFVSNMGKKHTFFKFVSNMFNKRISPNTQNNEGTTCLMLVVTNYSITKKLLDIGADPTVQDHEGNTVLHHLCSTTLKREKKREILELLLRSKTDINTVNHEGCTPLNRMIKEKTTLNVEDVQDLLMQKADPNVCFKGCNSPLINSLLRCKLDVAFCLLKAGGDVHHEGKSGLTALHAILNLELTGEGYIKERIEMIQKLLAAGSDVNKRDLEGNTGLNFCLKTLCKGRKDEVMPVIKVLLEAGADPNISDISGRRPLEIIINTSLKECRNETEIQELVEMLFIYGAKCNERKKGQDSVLHMAVSNGLEGVVQILVTRGADVNHQGKYRQIPLHRYFLSEIKDKLHDPALHQTSVESKSRKILDILLPLTRDPNIEDENGDSPLNLACACLASKNKDDIRKLLQAGADPLHKGQENIDAFEKCIATGNFTALEILLQEKGSNHITDLHFTAFWNASKIQDAKLYQRVALLMLSTNENINVNIRNRKGDTPLAYFCHQNATDVIRKLVERGADVNVLTTKGWNILHFLCDSPDVESKLDTISLIIKSNLDLEVQDISGKTVLQRTIEKYRKFYFRDGYSTYKCLSSIIEHLLNAGAKCRKTELTSLLQMACKHQHFALMKALVKRGADPSVKKSEKGILHDCWFPYDFYKIVITPSLLKECIEYIEFHKEVGGSLTEVYEGCTPLDMYLKSAIYKKSEKYKELRDEIDSLLACNEEVCESDRRLSAVHIAASTGRLSKLKTLVEKGANLLSKDRDENSCLHLCLSSGVRSIEDMVSYLLEQGLSPNDMNSSHETPLYLILKNAKYHSEDEVSSIVKLLINFGGNPSQEKLEKNPLIIAIETFNAKCINILLKNGAKVNDLPSGLTALHVMYDSILSGLVKDQKEDIFFLQHLLITNQVNLNAKNSCGDSVLHLAVKVLCNRKKSVGAKQLIQELVEHGSDVNATDCNGQTALSLCCEFGCDIECIAVCKYFLENGADPNKGCALNRAFSHVQCGTKEEAKELIFRLLSHGANPNDETEFSHKPNLIVAINMGEADLVRALLESGAHPNTCHNSGTSLLHACNLSFHSAKEVVPLLLQYGCSINMGQHGKPYTSYRQHPLFSIVDKMTKNHEYIDISEDKIVEKVDLRMFNLLLCGGCDLSVLLRPCNKGKSILASLTKAGYFKAAETLIRCGYNFEDDIKFRSINFSELDISTLHSKRGMYHQDIYHRANYESEVENFQEMLKRIKEPQVTLQSLCRKAIRRHLVFVHNGSEIETIIRALPLPEVLKNYLTHRDYTQDFENIEFYREPW
ncbi:ankyrin-2-like [Saccostrea echinata]|uniref:ankyrin-2-like n=1 Tax=Saccostrea echinata TaxID=191078 RepID=UPI002A80E313|nr:ankyrin-2-like [Saccostrea echinata]